MRVLFIHRSVGNNLIAQGRLYELIDGDTELCDFNQNTGVLRTKLGSEQTALKMPGGDTHPSNYAELFSDKSSDMLDFVMNHDVVAIKSCYPNSNIKSDEELERIKNHYEAIASFFLSHPEKRLIIFTSPPLQPLKTNTSNTARAMQLANWLTKGNLGNNVQVFDFFSLLADKKGYLKREYRRLIPFDSHPNKKANTTIAPVIAEVLARSQP